MAQLSAHTLDPPLSLVSPPSAVSREEAIYLPAGEFGDFLAAAASAGLEAGEAVQMGLERGLALADAAELGLDVESARAVLNRAAARARPQREIGTDQAERVRYLKAARPLRPAAVDTGLIVEVSDRLLARLEALAPSCLRAEIVTEAIAWEVASCLAGRTIGEWALWTLCRSRSAA